MMIAVMIVCLQSGMAVTCRDYIGRDVLDRTHSEATIDERADEVYGLLRHRFGPVVLAVRGECRPAGEAL